MKKQFWQITVLIFLLALILCACGTAPENEYIETTIPTKAISETTESEIEPDPAWLADPAIDEAYAYLFPLEGEKNVELAQEILLPLVEAGNAEAQYYWGYIYDLEMVDSNDSEKESLYWYNLAADQGFPKAYLAAVLNAYTDSDKREDYLEMTKQSGLFEMEPQELGADGCALVGLYYYESKKYDVAMDWFLKAANMGSTYAMMHIGRMHYYGESVRKDYSSSLEWFLKSANLGHVDSMHWYGYVLIQEDVITETINQKYATSLENYLEAANNGDPVAMCNVGYMYEYGHGGLSMNNANALDWYHKAADLGDAHAMYSIALLYQYNVGDYAKAMEWHLKAAEFGNVDAMSQIRIMYEQGWGVAKDTEEAKKWADKAQACANNDVIIDNGRYLSYSSDIEELKNAAIEWLQKAADAGHAAAMNNIGYYGYEKGYINLNDGQARTWYKKAADVGNATAMANLGFNYYRSKDYDSAMEWLIKAHVNGTDYVADNINNMLMKKQGVNAYFENYGELISVKP